MKLLLSSVVFDGPLKAGEMTQADLIPIARDLGLDGLELRETYWQGGEVEIDATLSQLWEEGMDVVYATSDTLVGKDLESTLAGLQNMLRNVYLAAKMRATVLRINVGPLKDGMQIVSDERYLSMLEKIREESEELGIILALENPPQLVNGSILTINWVLTQFPFIKVTFDTANWLVAGDNPLTALETFKNQIVYVHLKDIRNTDQKWEFHSPGTGEVSFPELFEGLAKLNYQGYYALEYPGENQPRASLEKVIAKLEEWGVLDLENSEQ